MRILLVEDMEINQQVATLLLGRLGYTAAIANNGVEALEAVARERFDLIFLDMQMPEMDGEAATRAIRALPGPVGRIPIIAMTANVMPEQRSGYLSAGMDAVVSKPVDAQALQAALRQVTAQRHPTAA